MWLFSCISEGSCAAEAQLCPDSWWWGAWCMDPQGNNHQMSHQLYPPTGIRRIDFIKSCALLSKVWSLWHDALISWGQSRQKGSSGRPIAKLPQPRNVRVFDQSGGAARSQRGQRPQIKCLTPIHPLKPSSQSSQGPVANLHFRFSTLTSAHTPCSGYEPARIHFSSQPVHSRKTEALLRRLLEKGEVLRL